MALLPNYYWLAFKLAEFSTRNFKLQFLSLHLGSIGSLKICIDSHFPFSNRKCMYFTHIKQNTNFQALSLLIFAIYCATKESSWIALQSVNQLKIIL